jgi:hypothetical protein
MRFITYLLGFSLTILFLSQLLMFNVLADDQYLVGAWYFSGWHDEPKPVETQKNDCSITKDYWDWVKFGKNRETDYLYTLSSEEKTGAKSFGYEDEPDSPHGYLFSSLQTSSKPLYRLRKDSIHFYTSSELEKTEKVNQGFILEGVIGYAFNSQQSGTLPLYRITLYDTIYELTTNRERVDWAISQGYNQAPVENLIQGYVYTTNASSTLPLFALNKPLPGQTKLPRQPALGYVSDMNQEVMDSYITNASTNGIDFFAFDWYWAPRSGCSQKLFLHEALENSFMKSSHVNKIKFAVAWFPFNEPYSYTMASAKEGFDYFLTTYATHPSYLKIDNKPVFYWDPYPVLVDLGNDLPSLKALMTYANTKAEERGFSGVYFIDIGDSKGSISPELQNLGFSGFTSYSYINSLSNFLESTDTKSGPVKLYEEAIHEYRNIWSDWANYTNTVAPSVNFIPTILTGWDRSSVPHLKYRSQILTYVTPELFKSHLYDVKGFLDTSTNTSPNILMIQAWNEWFEGSILEPDTVYGENMLQQIASVFPNENLPGDTNGDNKVDGVDYVTWLTHYNQQTSDGVKDGDFNNDGKVDGVDYVIWLTHYHG